MRERIKENSFGTVSEFDIGDRCVRVYRGRPGQKTGGFYREKAILSLILQGKLRKNSSSETAILESGSLGLLRYVDVQRVTTSDAGATWINIELGNRLSERANDFFKSFRNDVIRTTDSNVLAEGYRLLNFLSVGKDFPWDQEELVERIVDGIFRDHYVAPRRLAVQLQEIIHSDYGTSQSFAKICEGLNGNPSHVGRVFKKQFGISPGEYLRRTRITAAFRLMLDSDRPLISIATECGFADESHLCRTIKSYTRCTPTHWRTLPHLEKPAEP